MVSVIIPAYNAEKYIKDALDSVLTQTYKDVEIIMVDDGSTDNTAEIVKEYAGTHIDIKYIYQMNKGPAVARNAGIKAAKGEYIAFLDSDDAWLPEKLAKQVKILEENKGIALICTGRFRLDEKKENKIIDCKGDKLTNDNYLDFWVKGNFVITSSVLLRKRCFEACGVFDDSEKANASEDKDMWLRILEKYEIFYINEPLIEYRVRETGFCRSDIKRAYEASEYIINKHKNKLENRYKNYKTILKNVWFRYYFNYGITLSYLRKKECSAKFRKALEYRPYSLRALFYFLLSFLYLLKMRLR